MGLLERILGYRKAKNNSEVSNPVSMKGVALTITVMSTLLTIGLVSGGGTILYLLLDRRDNAVRDYMLLSLFCGVLAMLAYLVELNISDLGAKITAIKFGYLGKLLINPLLICFALRYYEATLHWFWRP